MYKRRQFNELKSRIEEARNKIQVISGPRQVGKSTLVKQVLKEISIDFTFISADNVEKDNLYWINEVWETARQRMKLKKEREYLLVIDEVHKVNNWSEAVKKEWDDDTFNDVNIKVILLGSSRLLIKDGLTESLAGRYELIHMSHWSFKEMKEAFGMDLEHYIFFGGYPGGVGFINNEVRWRKYIKDSIVAPAIAHDILMTKTIYKPELMKQLFELGCTYSGEEIALTKLLGQLQDAGNITTLANYLSTLNESHLLCGLQKYANDNARKYNSVPKMMVYNTALLSSLYGLNYSQVFTNPKMWGRWVESAVGTHLLNMANELDYRIYYWRERNDEVDFILEYNRQCIAIEVKSGRRTTNAGISVFKEKFRPLHTFIVGNGGIPLEEFLSSDLKYLFE
ncbi:MAG: ATP-binding protein [Bacteroidales bacterium]|jgi:predicted AAA+ superfamily ATPase|nr:ATP-binding protein [Bacteroidales bacterium]MEE1251864.1 ATP-binding protein [Bacteroidales bacterium]MEE1302598.1 ATP-binding protein [Bacteroidales bacterium]